MAPRYRGIHRGGDTLHALPPCQEDTMKRAVLSLVLCSLLTGMLSACHTMAGVGKDVKEVGEEVEETAEGH
jgi:predicted small secreted protein